MKKFLILITLFVAAILTSVIFAEDDFKWKCEADLIEGTVKTTTCWYYSSDGEKVVHPEKGYAGKTDVYGKILPDSGSYNQISVSYLDPDGNPMIGPNGYAKVTIEYELQKEDEPVCAYWKNLADGICGYTYRYFDTDGEPVIAADGYGASKGGSAAYTMSQYWTDEGFIQRESYYDTDGTPVIPEALGYSVREKIMSNEKTIERFLGTDGELIVSPSGYAYSVSVPIAHRVYDTQYFDAEGNQIPETQLGVYALPYPYNNEPDREFSEDDHAVLKDLKTGDEFTFGVYEQDNDLTNGWEPIEWQVLAVEDGRALVISKYGLDDKPFVGSSGSAAWETSSIRAWLNGVFYENVFSPAERDQIIEVSLENPAGPQRNMITGSDVYYPETSDRIFLLSLEETIRYFQDEGSRICQPTAYTESLFPENLGNAIFWSLRTEGVSSGYIMAVDSRGSFDQFVIRTSYSSMIRPAFWIDL